MIVNKDKELAGGTVLVKWERPVEGACPVVGYNVYSREVISRSGKSKWNIATVQKNATEYILYLRCRKQYEVAVTSLVEHRESALNESWIWNFKTGGGTTTLFAAVNMWVLICNAFFQKPGKVENTALL